jgi:hypothetical protein
MKKLYKLLLLAAMIMLAFSTSAQLIVYEPFNYLSGIVAPDPDGGVGVTSKGLPFTNTTGSPAGISTGLTNASNAYTGLTVATGLTYSGLLTSANAGSITSTTEYGPNAYNSMTTDPYAITYRGNSNTGNFSPTASVPLYFSFLAKTSTPGTDYTFRLGIGGGTYTVWIANEGGYWAMKTNGTYVRSTKTVTANQTYLIVAKITTTGTSIFIDPSIGGNEPTADATISQGSHNFSRLKYQSSTANTMTVDEFRMGLSYADVTPASTVPTQPVITGINSTNGQLTVDFTAPSNNGGSTITNYQYSIDGGATYTAFSPAQTSSPLTISGVNNSTNYNVYIKAVNSTGAGLPSNMYFSTNLIMYEPFNYTVGTTDPNPDAGVRSDGLPATNFSGNSTSTGLYGNWGTYTTVATGLTYPGLQTTGASANAIVPSANTWNNGTTRAYRFLSYNDPYWNLRYYSNALSEKAGFSYDGTTAQTYYISFLAKVTNISADNNFRLVLGATGDNNGGAGSALNMFVVSTAAGKWTLSPNGSNASSTAVCTANETALLLIKMEYTGGNVNFSLWKNPTLSGSLPSANATATMTYTLFNGFFAFGYRPNSLNGMYFDELRLGRTAADVLPSNLPTAPTITGITPGNTSLSVAFTAPSSNGGSAITDYKYSTNGGSSWTSAGTTSSPISITGLSNGVSYNVQLRAVNANGDGTATGSTSATTSAISTAVNASDMNFSSSSAVQVAAGGTLTVDATPASNIQSLTVASTGKVTINNNYSLSITGNLQLQSDASGTATLVNKNSSGGLTVSGTTTVQQYLPVARNWYMSSPVSGATGLPTVNTGALTIYSYPESDALQETGGNGYVAGAVWNTVVSPAIMDVKTGYIVKPSAAPATVTFTGTGLNTANQTISGLTYTAANPKHGFNLVGNPYPSYINVLSAITTNTEMEATVWYKTRDTQTTPAYHVETVNATSGVGTNASGTGRVTGYIPPMQAFWVRAKSNNQSITLSNDNRSHAMADVSMPGYLNTPTTPLKAPKAANQDYQILGLNVSNGTYGDEAIVMVAPQATNGLDAYDSGKMTNGNNNIPEIFTLSDGTQLAINGLGNLTYETEMPLGFTTGTAGTFSIQNTLMSNFETGTKVILKDYADSNNPVEADLTNGSYTFSSDVTSNNTSRFSLLFRAPGVATDVDNPSKNNVQVYVNAANQLVISASEKSNYAVYNAVGQQLAAGTVINHLPLTINHSKGVYVVKVGGETRKIIVK